MVTVVYTVRTLNTVLGTSLQLGSTVLAVGIRDYRTRFFKCRVQCNGSFIRSACVFSLNEESCIE